MHSTFTDKDGYCRGGNNEILLLMINAAIVAAATFTITAFKSDAATARKQKIDERTSYRNKIAKRQLKPAQKRSK